MPDNGSTVLIKQPPVSVVDRRTVEIPSEQVDARIAFGAAIRIWFRINRWSQEVPHHFAKARDLNGPWNSQMSLLMAGKLDPKAQFWVSMEEFNQTVYSKDFGGLDEALAKRMDNRVPFLTDEGRPADAVDFYGMFIGRIGWDAKYDSEPLLSELEAEQKGVQLHRSLETIMLQRMMTRKELWDLMLQRMEGGHASDDPEKIQRWLVGIDTYTPQAHLAFGKAIEELIKDLK